MRGKTGLSRDHIYLHSCLSISLKFCDQLSITSSAGTGTFISELRLLNMESTFRTFLALVTELSSIRHVNAWSVYTCCEWQYEEKLVTSWSACSQVPSGSLFQHGDRVCVYGRREREEVMTTESWWWGEFMYQRIEKETKGWRQPTNQCAPIHKRHESSGDKPSSERVCRGSSDTMASQTLLTWCICVMESVDGTSSWTAWSDVQVRCGGGKTVLTTIYTTVRLEKIWVLDYLVLNLCFLDLLMFQWWQNETMASAD